MMKNKLGPIIAWAGCIGFSLLVILYLVGFRMYKMATTAMEGALHVDELLVVKHTKNVVVGDIIVFNAYDNYERFMPHVYRAVAQSGDTLRIDDGKLYVNNIAFEEHPLIEYGYRLSSKRPIEVYLKELAKCGCDVEPYMYRLNDEFVCYFNSEEVKEVEKLKGIEIKPLFEGDEHHQMIFNPDSLPSQNADNYGPIIIPSVNENGEEEKMYFVMGDCRHNARDSRYIGFIPESDVVGVVLY